MNCVLCSDTDKELLFVADYDGETGQGIGNEFYTRTLPSFAKKIGLRYIKGKNNN